MPTERGWIGHPDPPERAAIEADPMQHPGVRVPPAEAQRRQESGESKGGDPHVGTSNEPQSNQSPGEVGEGPDVSNARGQQPAVEEKAEEESDGGALSESDGDGSGDFRKQRITGDLSGSYWDAPTGSLSEESGDDEYVKEELTSPWLCFFFKTFFLLLDF